MREVSETEPVGLEHKVEEGAKEGKESMMIRGLPSACVQLMNVILLDKRGKRRISEKKKIKFLREIFRG